MERAPIPEIGWLSVAADTSAEPGLIDTGPWLSWHLDRFTVPADVPVIARTALASQAFVTGGPWGCSSIPR